ncbi:EamA family transporter [Autumnicola musiva]|uniref:EamA family transporter n=1 Tax=Autumnicola musiva TaxID=3075589 RepID=A0ABU3DC58_9FLAO|nr:EamA family transporter [Zunongwangia sp. F117]MDT0678558.1 EamA family transporter [Zunongwangia sp. F117]
MGKSRSWFFYAIITTVFWGVWGALIEIPEKEGFPATLGYVTWSLTMIPCAVIALYFVKWKIETNKRSILLGSAVGILGAGGQLLLFQALRDGPAYIIFPLISLSPALTILLSVILLKEKTSFLKWIGIATAMVAIFFLSYQEPGASDARGYLWLGLSILVFAAWGLQAFIMKFSNETMKAESIFFYMALMGLILAPFALWMTDFSQPINWGFKGPYLAAIVHVLNAIGALTLVYAFRYGKAIIVAPLTGLAPLITIVLSLIIYGVMPGPILIIGLILAIGAIFILSI